MDEERSPRLSVIVAAYNAERTIARCLAALAGQDASEPWELIIVDDGSTDATPELLDASPVAAKVIRQARTGPAIARNAAAAVARGSALAFTDADCFPDPGWLREGLAALESADLVQGVVLPDGEARLGPFDRTLWVGADNGLYQTANLFMDRATFERAGGFEDWINPSGDARGHFGEDVLIGWQARRAGARPAFSRAALVKHAVIPRGPIAYIGERARLRYFPGLLRRVPELRSRFAFIRAFLSRRSAAFDLALLSVVVWLASGSALALAAILPYTVLLGAGAAPWRGGRAVAALAVEPLADMAGFLALLYGSLRYRSPLL